MRIGLLEDDKAQADLVSMWLTDAKHRVHHFDSGRRFLDSVNRETFDLLILDWNVPDLSGPAVLARIRDQEQSTLPVIFMTSRDRDEDIVFALKNGADDYMTKPVKQAEVLARIEAVARRVYPAERKEILEFAPFSIDMRNQVISRRGEPVQLTQKEYELATFLFMNRGRLLSRGYLLENVWGTRPDLNTRTVDTHASRVRSRLGLSPPNGWRLKSIYQHGYRLEEIEAH